MKNIVDDRGYSQLWGDCYATRVRTQRRCDFWISEMDPRADKTVLEIGCGSGVKSYLLARQTDMSVLGTDVCAPFIEEAKIKYALPNLRYELLDFHQPDRLNGQKFDYIVGDGILHHLYPRLDEALVQIRSLLKDDGKIIFLEPNILNPYVYAIFSFPFLRKMTHLEPDEMAFSKRFIIRKLKQAGYEEAKVDYKDFLLPYVPDLLVKPLIRVGGWLEKIFFVKQMSQSIFIRAKKGNIQEE